MDRFESLTAFTRVVEKGGFAAAARDLGLTRSAVNKHVLALEDRLGARLFNRTTRQVSPTEAGLAYYERCVAILADLSEADEAVAALDATPRGTLRVNAPMSFGTLHLGAATAEFMTAYPDIRVELILNDRFIDPVEEGFDLTVRIAELADSSLVARRIAPVRRVLCASPDFLDTHGPITRPADLRDLPCLHYGNMAGGNRWRLSGPDGDHDIRVTGPVCSNNGEVLMQAALRGLGIALLPTFIVGPALRRDRLETVLAGYEPPPVSVHAVYPPNRRLAAKVRVFIDFLVGRFAGGSEWEQGG